MAQSIAALFIFVSGWSFLTLTLALLVIREKRRIHYLAAALIGDFGLMCIAGGVCTYHGFVRLGDNIAVFVPMVLLAPLGSTFALECFAENRSESWFERLIHGGTAVVMASCTVLVALGNPWRVAFTVTYGWLFGVYLAFVVFEGYQLRPIGKLPRLLRDFYLLVCFDVFLIGGMFACQPFDYYAGMYIFWALLIFSILATAMLAVRSPQAYEKIAESAKSVRYKRPRLTTARASSLVAALDASMNRRKSFCDVDLNLETLAASVGMTPAELSELINLHLGQNFSSYINRFRVEHAKADLLKNPKKSILDVAFDSGFKSKSTFNAVFQQSVGTTPSEYRRKP